MVTTISSYITHHDTHMYKCIMSTSFKPFIKVTHTLPTISKSISLLHAADIVWAAVVFPWRYILKPPQPKSCAFISGNWDIFPPADNVNAALVNGEIFLYLFKFLTQFCVYSSTITGLHRLSVFISFIRVAHQEVHLLLNCVFSLLFS